METSPCLTGSLVFAAAAAIGAEPSPDSLEKIPLATPLCIAINSVPTAPPVTADGLNAPYTTVTIAAGISVILQMISVRLITT